MAKRGPIPRDMPDAVREAVDRTVQATIGSAQFTRGRAQDAVDELVRTAESRAGAVRERVIEAFEERRLVTNEDLSEIRSELRKISRRLGAIERRLGETAATASAPARGARSTPGSRSGTAKASRAGARSGSGSRGGSGAGGGRSSGGAAAAS